MTDEAPTAAMAADEASRRDFIHIAAAAAAAGAGAAALWPMIAQMNPSADTIAQGSPIAVDLSKIQAGRPPTRRMTMLNIFLRATSTYGPMRVSLRPTMRL